MHVQSVPSVGLAVTVNSVVAAKAVSGKASAALPVVRILSTRGATGSRLVRPQPQRPRERRGPVLLHHLRPCEKSVARIPHAPPQSFACGARHVHRVTRAAGSDISVWITVLTPVRAYSHTRVFLRKAIAMHTCACAYTDTLIHNHKSLITHAYTLS